MKNVLKKVSAIAMALTLLGSGTAIATKIDPKSDTTITASAACNHNCSRNAVYEPWTTYANLYEWVTLANGRRQYKKVGVKQYRRVWTECSECGYRFGQAYWDYRVKYD